jgi:hypothetical protein
MKTVLEITSGIPLAGTTAGAGTRDDGAPISAVDEGPALAATCERRYQSPTGSAPCGGPLAHRRRGRSVLAASMECTWCGHVPQPPRKAC